MALFRLVCLVIIVRKLEDGGCARSYFSSISLCSFFWTCFMCIGRSTLNKAMFLIPNLFPIF